MIYSLVFGMSRTKKRVISLFIDVVLLISAFSFEGSRAAVDGFSELSV